MINSNLTQVKTYVGEDGKLHFVDSGGADTALNFSNTSGDGKWTITTSVSKSGSTNAYIWSTSGSASLNITITLSKGVLTVSGSLTGNFSATNSNGTAGGSLTQNAFTVKKIG